MASNCGVTWYFMPEVASWDRQRIPHKRLIKACVVSSGYIKVTYKTIIIREFFVKSRRSEQPTLSLWMAKHLPLGGLWSLNSLRVSTARHVSLYQ